MHTECAHTTNTLAATRQGTPREEPRNPAAGGSARDALPPLPRGISRAAVWVFVGEINQKNTDSKPRSLHVTAPHLMTDSI